MCSELPQKKTFLTALKIISYATIIFPLIARVVQLILHTVHDFHIIDMEKSLAGDFEVPKEVIDKIIELEEEINNRTDTPQIKWSRPDDTDRSQFFELTQFPDFLFRIDFFGVYNKIKNAESVIHAHQLDCLKIPRTVLLKPFEKNILRNPDNLLTKYPLIVQKKLPTRSVAPTTLDNNDNPQTLRKTISQFVNFISKTGYRFVMKGHIPLIDETHIALNFVHQDFFVSSNFEKIIYFTQSGEVDSKGIFGMFSPVDFKHVLDAARKYGLRFDEERVAEWIKDQG